MALWKNYSNNLLTGIGKHFPGMAVHKGHKKRTGVSRSFFVIKGLYLS